MITISSETGGSGLWRMYQNGVEIRTMAAQNLAIPGTPLIGTQNGFDLDGMFDEFRLSTGARSADWVWASWLNVASNSFFNTFETLEVISTNQPVIVALPATNISNMGADLVGSLIATGGAPTVVDVYLGPVDAGPTPFGWGLTNEFGVHTTSVPSNYIYAATNLIPNTVYYYRYRATNMFESWWSEPQSFTVLGPPIVDNGPGATGIGPGSATLNGSFLTANQGDVIFYHGLTDGGTSSGLWDNAISLGPVAGATFSSPENGLLYGVTNYYRTYATNAEGDNWAPTTTPFKVARPPVVLTNGPASSLTATSAVLNGFFDGTGSVFEVSVFWGTTDGTTNVFGWSNTMSLGWFTNAPATNFGVPVSGLSSNATHYFAFRMTNCSEVFWAQTSSVFSTKGPPVVNNQPGPVNEANGVTRLHGSLAGGGIADVSIFWGLSDGGTDVGMWDNVVNLGTRQQGVYSALATGLTFGVQYFYRAYATNACGLAWATNTVAFKSRRPFREITSDLMIREFENQVGQDEVNPISTLQNRVETGISIETGDINYNGNFSTIFPSIADNVNFAMLWEGTFIPPNGPGTYSFGVNHDDRIALVLDLDGDGDFDDGTNYDPGELIVNGGAISGGCCGTQTGQAILQDRPYRFALGFEQGGGAAFIDARWAFGPAVPFASMTRINGGSGDFTGLREEIVGIENFDASSITATSAVFNATFRGTGSVYTVLAYYGTTDGGTNAVSWSNVVNVGTFTNLVSNDFAVLVSGLASNQQHYYRFRMTNCADSTWALSSTVFETQGPPMVDNASGAGPIGSGLAQLNGTLLTGGVAFVSIYWGPFDGGTDTSQWDNVIQLGAIQPDPFSFTVSNLVYGIPYYYRSFATNAIGGSWAPSSEVFKVDQTPISSGEGLFVREFEGQVGNDEVSPISVLQNKLETGSGIQTDDLNYANNWASVFPSIADNLNFSMLWEGFFVPPNGAGVYSFGFNHDDHSAIVIDLDNDGDFDDGVNYDPGELIVDGGVAPNNACCGTQIGDVMLDDRPYRFAIGFTQGPGGAVMDARWAFGAAIPFAAQSSINGTSGVFFLDFVPFDIANLTPVSVTESSAVIRATLIESNSVWGVDAFWGPTDGGTNVFSWSNSASLGFFSNGNGQVFSQPIAGLVSNTTYYYTFRATNCAETMWGEPAMSFKTPGLIDIDNGAGVTDITAGSARLNGDLLAGGLADATFYFGTTDGGMNTGAWQQAISVDPVGEGPFSMVLSGLVSGIEYYYRTYATNVFGPDWATNTLSFKLPAVSRPDHISGLALWLNASTIGSNHNDIVGFWPDDSGNSRPIENRAGAGNDPTFATNALNGLPVVRYDGNDHHFTTHNFVGIGDHSIFTVARYTNPAGGNASRRVVSTVGGNWLFGFWNNGDERWFADGWIHQTGTANTNWHLHAGTLT
ncbi:MAG: fibronectin type III domain-containing protein, partial [Verrucomicrobiota bacterium]